MSDRERHNPELALLLERKVFIEDKLKDIKRVIQLRERMMHIITEGINIDFTNDSIDRLAPQARLTH